MGRPKAWLDFGGVPLLQRIVNRLAPTFPEFVVVAAPGQDLPETGARVVADEEPGEGPVAGMVVGLKAVTRPLVLVLACDVPFVSPGVGEFLVDGLRAHDVVVPEWEGRLHPLQAAYRASVQPTLAALFAAGHRRPVDLYQRVSTRTVRDEELRPLDRDGATFTNLNHPEEYAAALVRLREGG